MAQRISARPLSELDRASRERLEALLGKEKAHLTDGDKAFLVARRAYLTAEQRKDFGIKGDVDLENIVEPEGDETGEGTAAESATGENAPAAPARAPRKRAARKTAGKRGR